LFLEVKAILAILKKRKNHLYGSIAFHHQHEVAIAQ